MRIKQYLKKNSSFPGGFRQYAKNITNGQFVFWTFCPMGVLSFDEMKKIFVFWQN